MAGRWGQLDNKKACYVLGTGISFLRDEVKEADHETLEMRIQDYYNLDELLYGEARNLISLTNAVKFEKALNTIKKKMIKKLGHKF